MVKKKSKAMPDYDKSDFAKYKTSVTKYMNIVADKKKEIVLKLEKTFRPKTRTQMYKELEDQNKYIEEKDIFTIPNHAERAAAFIIDLVFMFAIVEFSFFISPIVFKGYQLFLYSIKLESQISPDIMRKIIPYLNSFLGLFLFVVSPTSLVNCSLGKKLLKLRVRGDENYTLSFGQVFAREFIAKPFGIIFVIGFILPFFDKKYQKSVHDRVSGTFVIKD